MCKLEISARSTYHDDEDMLHSNRKEWAITSKKKHPYQVCIDIRNRSIFLQQHHTERRPCAIIATCWASMHMHHPIRVSTVRTDPIPTPKFRWPIVCTIKGNQFPRAQLQNLLSSKILRIMHVRFVSINHRASHSVPVVILPVVKPVLPRSHNVQYAGSRSSID